jgi:hypothetical protein
MMPFLKLFLLQKKDKTPAKGKRKTNIYDATLMLSIVFDIDFPRLVFPSFSRLLNEKKGYHFRYQFNLLF